MNVGQFEEVFRRHAKNGDALLYIAFSSVLSGTYQSAVMARDMILDEHPEAIIEIVDTWRQQVEKVISLSWRQKLVTKVRAYLKQKP